MLLEAMAAGCAVVATNVGGVPEIVEDERSGLLVSPGQPEQLAVALVRLAIDAALRHRLAVGAQRHVRERFDVAHMVRQHAELYQQLPADGGRLRGGRGRNSPS